MLLLLHPASRGGGFWNLNSSSLACTISSLTTELSPTPSLDNLVRVCFSVIVKGGERDNSTGKMLAFKLEGLCVIAQNTHYTNLIRSAPVLPALRIQLSSTKLSVVITSCATEIFYIAERKGKT